MMLKESQGLNTHNTSSNNTTQPTSSPDYSKVVIIYPEGQMQHDKDDGNETHTTMENTTSLPPSSPPRLLRKKKYYPKYKATASAQRALIYDIENAEYYANDGDSNSESYEFGGGQEGRRSDGHESTPKNNHGIVCFGKNGTIVFAMTVAMLIIVIVIIRVK